MISSRKKKIEQSGMDKGQMTKLMGVLIQWSEGGRVLINYFTIVDKARPVDRFLCSRCQNDCLDLPDMLG